jgi:hypothetical protein
VQQENFGDISFPTIGSIQQTVFCRSALGKMAKQYLGHQLIATTAADRKAAQIETWGHQRENTLSEVLGEKK